VRSNTGLDLQAAIMGYQVNAEQPAACIIQQPVSVDVHLSDCSVNKKPRNAGFFIGRDGTF